MVHDECQWRGSGEEKISGLRQLRVNREKGGKKIKQGIYGYVFSVTLRKDHCSHRGTCKLYVENSHFLSWSLHMFQTSPNVESQEIVTGMTGSLHVLLSFHNIHILLLYEMCLVFIDYKVFSLFYKDLSEGKTY